jgi:four helix bundle protein
MESEKAKFKSDFRKRLYFFTLKMIEFIDSLPKDNVSQRISDELFASGTNMISNYIEGQAAKSRKEFTDYFNTALKSTNECKLWLALLRDSKRAKSERIKWFLDELDEIAKILNTNLKTP